MMLKYFISTFSTLRPNSNTFRVQVLFMAGAGIVSLSNWLYYSLTMRFISAPVFLTIFGIIQIIFIGTALDAKLGILADKYLKNEPTNMKDPLSYLPYISFVMIMTVIIFSYLYPYVIKLK